MNLVRILFGMLLVTTANLYATTNLAILASASRPDTLVVSHPATYVAIDTETYGRALRVPDRTTIEVPLDIPDLGRVTLTVERFRVFAPDAVLTAMTATGPIPIVKAESVLLRGSIKGMPASHVMLATHPNYAVGYIDVGTGAARRRFLISPTASPSTRVTMIIFDERYAQQPEPWNCATNDERTTPIDERRGKGGERTQAGTLRRVEMVIEGDFTYYQDHGSNAAVATEYAEDVIAACSDIYERDVAGNLFIKRWNVWTVNDPWAGTASNTLLTQFRDWGRTNLVAVNRSIAHMFSGVNGIGGIAYVDVLCSKDWGYAVDGLNNNIVYPRAGYVWDTDVTSHELGHNVGSPHTHSCSWAPPIDSCYNAEGGCYTGTKAVKGTIMSYCHLTAQGTNLEFHPRVQDLMKRELANAAACVPLISDLAVSAGNDTTVCPNTTSTLRVTTQGGTGPFTYSWSPTTYLTNPTSATPTITPARTTSYVCTVTDAMGMVRRDTVKITVNAQMVLTSVPTVMICEGDSVELAPSITSCGTGVITYSWTPTSALTATTTRSTVVFPTLPTPYTLTAVHECGDTARVTVNVSVYERPRVILPANATICRGDYLPIAAQVIRGTPAYALEWMINGEIDASLEAATVELQPDSSITIVLKATDQNGCVGMDTMTVTVHEPPVVELPSIEKVCAGTAIEVPATISKGVRPYRVSWFLGKTQYADTDSVLQLTTTMAGVLSCIVVDAQGCADTATTELKVRSLDLIMQPNRITLPPLEACQDVVTRQIEMRNISTDTIRIMSVGATLLTPSTALPIILAPGATRSVELTCQVPVNTDIRDTVRFYDEFCQRVYILSVSGRRGTVRLSTSAGLDLGTSSACDSISERRITASLRNTSATRVTITAIKASPTLGVAVSAQLPVSIPSDNTAGVPLVLRGAFPEGNILDSLVLEYSTASCQGATVIPIRGIIAPYQLGAPESIDFGLGLPQETKSRAVTLVPEVTGLSQLKVTGVDVTGPFQTDLEVGTVLKVGQPRTITVQFIPSKATTEGNQTGVLAIDIDSCVASTSIALSAQTLVSVREERNEADVSYDAATGTVEVRVPSATSIRVIDLLGRGYTVAPQGDVTRFPAAVVGPVFIVVDTPTDVRVRQVLLR